MKQIMWRWQPIAQAVSVENVLKNKIRERIFRIFSNQFLFFLLGMGHRICAGTAATSIWLNTGGISIVKALQLYSPSSSVPIIASNERYCYSFLLVFLVLLLIASQIRFLFPLYFKRDLGRGVNFLFEMLRFINSMELQNRIPADSIKKYPLKMRFMYCWNSRWVFPFGVVAMNQSLVFKS